MKMVSIDDIFTKLAEFKSTVLDSMEEVEELNITCKSILKLYLTDATAIESVMAIVKIQAVIDYMYEHINVGNWKEVKPFLRKTMTIASYLKLLACVKFSDEASESLVKKLYTVVDFGILFGCPLDKEPELLQKCATCLGTFGLVAHNPQEASSQEQEIVEIDSTKYNAQTIEVIDCPSMENFYNQYLVPEKPVVLANCVNHWPAMTKWQDQNYFLKLAGPRTVSVEVGRDYTESEWTQKLMTMEEFITNHVYQTNGPTGYLAQYQLFDQIPELKEDISAPEYCCFADSEEPVDVMAWYGPKGTVSPLHFDAKRNLLTQIVGEKQIFLFSPNDSENLYPHKHELLHNTARIDPRNPDFKKFPKYKDAKVYFCVLRPGQMLYIPPKWWHFVESLSISFSVSFWWK